ncbi:MAG: pyridoxal-phosphate dependent enzyme [Anaerolineales bacterium]
MALPVSTEKRVYDNILGAMGNTPLVRLGRIAKDLPVPLYAKLEWMNPGGSVKDRVGAFIIEQAEKRGELKPGGTRLPLKRHRGTRESVLPLPRH